MRWHGYSSTSYAVTYHDHYEEQRYFTTTSALTIILYPFPCICQSVLGGNNAQSNNKVFHFLTTTLLSNQIIAAHKNRKKILFAQEEDKTNKIHRHIKQASDKSNINIMSGSSLTNLRTLFLYVAILEFAYFIAAMMPPSYIEPITGWKILTPDGDIGL